MGVLSDFIIADADEAAAINAAGGAHLKRWDCLESKGIDAIKLWTLQQILAGQPLDDVNAAATFMANDMIAEASDDGPWVFKVPADLQGSIAALTPSALGRVAATWAATEEFTIVGRTAPVVEEYLHDLVSLAQRARAAKKSILLWMSL
jgi:hypothetical protein